MAFSFYFLFSYPNKVDPESRSRALAVREGRAAWAGLSDRQTQTANQMPAWSAGQQKCGSEIVDSGGVTPACETCGWRQEARWNTRRARLSRGVLQVSHDGGLTRRISALSWSQERAAPLTLTLDLFAPASASSVLNHAGLSFSAGNKQMGFWLWFLRCCFETSLAHWRARADVSVLLTGWTVTAGSLLQPRPV